MREARLDLFMQPLIEQWQSSELAQSLSSSEAFSKLLGLDDLQKYLAAREVHKIPDWSSCPLDDEGRALQDRMGKALEVINFRFPLLCAPR